MKIGSIIDIPSYPIMVSKFEQTIVYSEPKMSTVMPIVVLRRMKLKLDIEVGEVTLKLKGHAEVSLPRNALWLQIWSEKC